MEPTKYQGAQPSIELLLKGSETPASEAIAHTNTMLYYLMVYSVRSKEPQKAEECGLIQNIQGYQC
jgi:hypothetical protein